MTEFTQIQISSVNKHYGEFHALKDISLDIKSGEFVALVGPSGCGKSTLLRSLAGLETISSGTISIAGESVAKMPPRKRDLAMVFQSYALYPHMNVLENLTYSLRLKRIPRSIANLKAHSVAETTGLSDLLDRYPRELSGGQRQRVAMARAIIREPKAFLFDEPLSNLDASLRVQMRKEIRALHNKLNATSIYVTHDQIEAMTMADTVVVLQDGEIRQVGAPLELYRSPNNKFVASFLGSPSMNMLDGGVEGGEDGKLSISIPGVRITSIKTRHNSTNFAESKVDFGIRPEHLKLGSPDEADVQLRAKVQLLEQLGNMTLVHLETKAGLMIALTDGEVEMKVGENVGVTFDVDRVHLFSSNGQVL